MAITIGTEQITVEKNLVIKEVRLMDLDKPGSQSLYIEYLVNGVSNFISLKGYDLYNFYMNQWNDGRAIFNETSIRSLIPADLDLTTAEGEFVAGLPTELPVVEPPVEEPPVE